MPQTLINLYIHIIFSTKNRISMIDVDIEDKLFAYIAGISNSYKSPLIIANGTANHIHVLISMDKNVLLPELVGKIKRDSSKWLKTKGGRYLKFQWQDGYAAFSVGHTQLEDVKKYIANQKIHHSKTKFEDEMRIFFEKYSIEYDEKYMWD